MITRPEWHKELQSEADEQKMLVQLLRAAGVVFFSVPNEGKRNWQHLIAMGLLPGMGDLVIMSYDLPVIIEMKGKGGKVSENQIKVRKLAYLNGWPYLICWGCEDAWKRLQGMGVVR